MINTTESLAKACADLARFDVVTVDTEFLRETTFWPKLCVVQLASADAVYIVDALASGLDLTPLFDLMKNEAVLKVFHAARQDVEIFYNLGNAIPKPMFDTQVAAMVCGFGESVSYDSLVSKITGVHLDKTHRFTDWSRRPLSKDQLTYAEADVTHLRDVYRHLADRLEKEGRADWVTEEMAVLCSESTYRSDPEHAWQRLKMRVKKPRELLILQRLSAWREREAQSRDIPRSRVLKDDAIYELAMQAPADAQAMSQLRALGKGFERSKSGEEILAEVRAALEIPRDHWPKLPKHKQVPEGTSAAVDLLKVLLKLIAETEGVAAKVLATTDDLESIVTDSEADVPALKGWRREMFGDIALKLKRGEMALAFDGRKVVLVEIENPEEVMRGG